MDVTHVRSGKILRLSSPQTFMARERNAIEEAWPGDVVGVMDRGVLRIGDALSQIEGVEFQDIPRFPPEHFARVICLEPLRRKAMDAGLRQLTEEGAAQVFYTSATEISGPTPIIGAVGQLQFDVMLHRLEHEYGVKAKLEKISSRYPRWLVGPKDDVERFGRERGRMLLFDAKGNPLALFDEPWGPKWAAEREKELKLFEVAP
jgi:peptide chain release factor 3